MDWFQQLALRHLMAGWPPGQAIQIAQYRRHLLEDSPDQFLVNCLDCQAEFACDSDIIPLLLPHRGHRTFVQTRARVILPE